MPSMLLIGTSGDCLGNCLDNCDEVSDNAVDTFGHLIPRKMSFSLKIYVLQSDKLPQTLLCLTVSHKTELG